MDTTLTDTTLTKKDFENGGTLERALRARGVPVAAVVKHRDGTAAADFFAPGWNEPVDPATVWADRILQTLGDVRIISTDDWVNTWSDPPYIMAALVLFDAAPPAPPVDVVAPCMALMIRPCVAIVPFNG